MTDWKIMLGIALLTVGVLLQAVWFVVAGICFMASGALDRIS